MSPIAPSPGKLVGGRYRLEQMLVQGGMGNVWKAHHVALNAPVAIKFISPQIAEDEEAIGRFMLEAQSAAALRSSHIVQVFDFGIDDGTPFIAMELLQGESLAERLRRLGLLSPTDTGRILSQVARGIQYAHSSGIVHRDLKPDNIFIASEGDHEIAKVLDFGIAKSTTKDVRGHTSAQTRAGTLLGSPYYVSPEQAEGNRDIDHRSDLWALGIITYECLTGKRPFDSESLAGLLVKICTQPAPRPSEVAQVPSGFDEWFARATDKDRTRRFQSARELVDGFAKLLGRENHQIDDIAWQPNGDGASAESSVDAPTSANHTSTMVSTPHRATINDSALAVTPTLVQHSAHPRKRQALLLAAVLLVAVGVMGRFAGRPSSDASSRQQPQLTVHSAAIPGADVIQQSPPSDAAASARPTLGAPNRSNDLEVTPVRERSTSISSASAVASQAATPAPAPRGTRTAGGGAPTSSATEAPLPKATANVPDPPNPPKGDTKSLFRARKLPGEAP